MSIDFEMFSHARYRLSKDAIIGTKTNDGNKDEKSDPY